MVDYLFLRTLTESESVTLIFFSDGLIIIRGYTQIELKLHQSDVMIIDYTSVLIFSTFNLTGKNNCRNLDIYF